MTDKTNKKYDIHSRSDDYSKWYQSVVTMSDLIDYTSVSGCYVLKSLAYEIWEIIKSHLDKNIKSMGVENCYFPLFVNKSNLEKEINHFSGFTPEMLWTQTDDPVIQQKMNDDPEINELLEKLKRKGLNVHVSTNNAERYAIRPTSETIIYPHFANWIKKNGIYPKINQWVNVVRWETRQTLPFIRSREFLWQEGHTCYQSREAAVVEVYNVLKLYKKTYEDILAVPMIDGIKTKSETFPGAVFTTSIEGFLPDSGRGIQAATSHYYGTNFSKMFDIKDSNGQYVYQNSWGFTTRSIGIMIMTHSDNKGLVLPPKVAPIQVVLIACGLNSKTTSEEKQNINNILHDLCKNLNANGIRTIFDDCLNETPGMKFNKWEIKGVPLRIEFGPSDFKNNTITFVRRDTGVKEKIRFDHTISVEKYLNTLQDDMFKKALNNFKSNLVYCSDEKEMINALKEKKLVLIDWNETNDDGALEENLKKTAADNKINSTKILCIPNMLTLNDYGFNLDKQVALFGRTY